MGIINDFAKKIKGNVMKCEITPMPLIDINENKRGLNEAFFAQSFITKNNAIEKAKNNKYVTLAAT